MPCLCALIDRYSKMPVGFLVLALDAAELTSPCPFTLDWFEQYSLYVLEILQSE